MTSGQIAQLQDLSKCYMTPGARAFVYYMLEWAPERMAKRAKAHIRRLTHLYRHQIAAVKRNQKAAV